MINLSMTDNRPMKIKFLELEMTGPSPGGHHLTKFSVFSLIIVIAGNIWKLTAFSTVSSTNGKTPLGKLSGCHDNQTKAVIFNLKLFETLKYTPNISQGFRFVALAIIEIPVPPLPPAPPSCLVWVSKPLVREGL